MLHDIVSYDLKLTLVTQLLLMNFDEIVFGIPRANKSGAISVSVKHKGHKLRVISPRSRLSYYNEKSIETQISYCNKIYQIDNCIISNAILKNKEWFGKTLSQEKIRSLFRESITNGAFKARIIGLHDITVFDPCNNVINPHSIKLDLDVQLFVECSGIYFIGNEFGLSWKVLQVKLYPKDRLSSYSFFSDESDDSEAEPN
jgi:hypothetical protein